MLAESQSSASGVAVAVVLSMALASQPVAALCMGVCTLPLRALRTQQFLAFTATDLVNREAKQRLLLAQFEASRRGKLVSKTELDDFYQRLQVGGGGGTMPDSSSLRAPLLFSPWTPGLRGCVPL